MRFPSGFPSGRDASLSLACALVLVLVLGAGCGSVPKPAQPFTSARDALSLYTLTRAQVRAMRGEARVDQRGDEGRIKGTVLMFVMRPGRVRFDAMTQFGPAAILTSDGERFAYSDLRKQRFLEGETCPANIARLLNVPMTVEQTTELLLGGTPVLPDARAAIGWHPDGYYHVRVRSSDGRRQELDFGLDESDRGQPPARQALRLLRSELFDAQGRTVWRIRYDDYRAVARGTYRMAMPFEVHVEQPSAGRDTLIRFKQITLDPSIPPGAFVQEPRGGMEIEEASCE
jgi:hypothetical protein